MTNRDVRFLNPGGPVRSDNYGQIAQHGQATTIPATQRNGSATDFFRGFNGPNDIGRTAAGANGKQQVTFNCQRAKLAREYFFVAKIVTDSCQG